MERNADLPDSNLGRPAIGGEANLNLTYSTTTTSSSSSLFVPPPDFLSQLHAVFKRSRPLRTMQTFSRASRVLVSQGESSKGSVSATSVTAIRDRKLLQTVASRGAGRLLNVGSDQGKDGAVEIRTNPQEDSLLAPPSITGTVTNVQGNNMCPFGQQQREAELHADRKKASLSASSSHLVSSNDDFKKDQFSSGDNASLTFQKGGDQPGNAMPVNDQDLKQHDLPNMVICGTSGAQVMEKRDELKHNQHSVDPMTRSTVMGSSCATTISIHSGPTYQCTHAPLAGQTGFPTQTSAVENSLGVSAHILPEAREPMMKEGDKLQHYQQSLHMGEGSREKVASSNANHLQSQVPPANKSSSNVDVQPSQSSKVEKGPRKKKYDPDVFFEVNGKLYQKLGKIGSGGSSEVHKVITSDCTIYALKNIKLKGRDCPTAYGFCQEIEYLNKLKGKSNIIQLIDYEVTDKTLFQEVMNGSMTIKDGRIKDDQYIYMVLEYGEIDLAHMLSHKWKEVESSSWKIDGNWLQFYWQQMLEAVNTIHEERIVHSDLKPANFLLVRGSLKLIDFGIAKAILSDTTNIQRDAQVGTLNYMSPEAFMWNEEDSSGNIIKCGRPSDVWSLGCILYQMVYGKTPFAEYKTFWAKFKVITNKNHEITYEPVSNPLLIDLMRRCLAWDRNERWRIPQLLQHPFLVPPIPRTLEDNEQYKFLLERIGVHWDDPEVSRRCSELHEVIRNLERAHRN